MHEFDLIKKYFSKLSKFNKHSLDLNDDVFFDKKKSLVISIDTYNEGTHFLNFKKPELVIKKIIRSSISDLICKGVLPKFYFISGSGNKKSFTKRNLSKISNSLEQEQNKYGILLCGGDTTFSNKLSFSITSVGYSKDIVYRNKAKLHDDIYVTGNLGDSFIGLKILQNKIKTTKKFKTYFLNKYFEPEIQIKLTKKLIKFANSSIDISDGLIDDLEKLINKQKLSYKIWEEQIPISKNLHSYLQKNDFKKSNFISNGDDYQILFTASTSKSRIIENISKKLGIKISKIGKIRPNNKKSVFIDKKGEHLLIKNPGFKHQF
ncbi:thiamine-phosphate kinase [Candidatus Pelagibacter sp.]|jgi:thiamine-monophosphate kinase|nr:thiamine-phosphate kinase [Candidatus Pelagibacter sp.]MDC1077177.1 thiamine-phosphate kinase [Candidatus Pelagibacter sp.]